MSVTCSVPTKRLSWRFPLFNRSECVLVLPLGALTFSYAIPLKSEATDEKNHSTSLLVLRSEAHMRRFETGLSGLHFSGFVMQPALAANLKIGIVDLQRAATESPQAESARKKIDREFRKKDRKLIAKQKEIRKMEEDLVRSRDLASEVPTRP